MNRFKQKVVFVEGFLFSHFPVLCFLEFGVRNEVTTCLSSHLLDTSPMFSVFLFNGKGFFFLKKKTDFSVLLV